MTPKNLRKTLSLYVGTFAPVTYSGFGIRDSRFDLGITDFQDI